MKLIKTKQRNCASIIVRLITRTNEKFQWNFLHIYLARVFFWQLWQMSIIVRVYSKISVCVCVCAFSGKFSLRIWMTYSVRKWENGTQKFFSKEFNAYRWSEGKNKDASWPVRNVRKKHREGAYKTRSWLLSFLNFRRASQLYDFWTHWNLYAGAQFLILYARPSLTQVQTR